MKDIARPLPLLSRTRADAGRIGGARTTTSLEKRVVWNGRKGGHEIASHLPFMSAVVCCYNGADTVAKTIESLLAQDYPHDRYEIILVNDGSTDETLEIAERYPIRILSQANGGVSAARNAGLKEARGDIYVCIDDDCIMEPDFLRSLADGYENGQAVGVGGVVLQPRRSHSLFAAYVAHTDVGPAPKTTDEEPAQLSPLMRIWRYILSNIRREVADVPDMFEVDELFGANGSFPVHVLREVGGWSRELSGIEDRDLAARIRERYPGRPFYVVKAARIRPNSDNPDISFSSYMMRPYRRGPVNLRFHEKNHMMPPLFPFPVLVAILAVILMIVFGWKVLPFVMLLPLIVYVWWPLKAIKELSLTYAAFAYYQFAEETMTLIGLLRGYILRATHRIRRA